MLTELRARGWTIAAIARELELPYRTVQDWHLDHRQPHNAPSVRRDLERLLSRKRVPKKKAYVEVKPYGQSS
jgi:hypothetical protein